jgi:hypothetical protein
MVFLVAAIVCAVLAFFVLHLRPVRWRLFQLSEFVFIGITIFLAYAQLDYAKLVSAEREADNRLQLTASRLAIGVQKQITNFHCFAPNSTDPHKCDDMQNLWRRLMYEWPAVQFTVFDSEGIPDGNREGRFRDFMTENLTFFEDGYYQAGFRPMESEQTSLADIVKGGVGSLVEARRARKAAEGRLAISQFWYLFLAASAAMRGAVFVKDLILDARKEREAREKADKDGTVQGRTV